jgi:hypothetical protein
MRRKERIIVYVCSAIKDNNLISKMIEANTIEDAFNLFEKENNIKPLSTFGPFFKKKAGILNKNFDIKFKADATKQIIYNGWKCTALPLTTPKDCFYLFFNNRIDGQKINKPKPIIVSDNDIKENNEKIILK